MGLMQDYMHFRGGLGAYQISQRVHTGVALENPEEPSDTPQVGFGPADCVGVYST